MEKGLINPCKRCVLRDTNTDGPGDFATCRNCNDNPNVAHPIKRNSGRYQWGEEKCPYCDAEENKDIFFNFLPAMFGLEKENHDYNPDVTVFITDKAELELCVMMCDDYLVKETAKIKYCPFCGRRLNND